MPGDPLVAGIDAAMRHVSIRARHECRAIPAASENHYSMKVFQSAPGTNAGRSAVRPHITTVSTLFQSAPGTNAGRSAVRPHITTVSTLFQSAPGTNAGRSVRLRVMRRHGLMFQSAPGTNAGRSPNAARPPCCEWSFNPRPARMPGDPAGGLSRIAALKGFNPRPARMPGDPTGLFYTPALSDVSIRARHECRAIRRRIGILLGVHLFQSAPGTNAGRSGLFLL